MRFFTAGTRATRRSVLPTATCSGFFGRLPWRSDSANGRVGNDGISDRSGHAHPPVSGARGSTTTHRGPTPVEASRSSRSFSANASVVTMAPPKNTASIATPPMPVDAPAEYRRSSVVPQQPERWKCEAGEQHTCGGCALSGNEHIGGTGSASGNQGPPTSPEGGHGPAARTRTRRRCFRRLAPSTRRGPRCARMHSRL